MATTLYYSKPTGPDFQQIQITAKYLSLDLNSQEYNKKYDPLTLLTPEGTLNQPSTILLFLAKGQLSGQNQTDKLKVYQWFEHFNLEILPLLREIYEQIRNERPQNKVKYDYCLKQLLRELEVLNSHLKIRTSMVGDSVSLVDISLATQLQTAFAKVLNEDSRKKLPQLTRWFTFIRSAEPFRSVLGEISLCGKEFTVCEGEKKEEMKV